MLVYLSLAIIIISIIIIVVILIRKFPNLAAIDISSIPKERQADTRNKILVDRFKRNTASGFSRLLKKVAPWWKKIEQRLLYFYRYLLELEKRHQKSSFTKTQTKGEAENIEQKISRLLREAEELTKEENYAEAEKRYVEVISLDVKNIDAYAGLGKLYFKGKDYEQAAETLEYLLKINQENSEHYFSLAEVYKELGDNKRALENARRAIELAPNNPRLLDFLLNLAIIAGNKKLAVDTFRKLKKANPENEKLAELEKRIKEI